MKWFILVTLTFPLLFAACSKDKQSNNPPPAELLLGRWYIEKTTSPDGDVDTPNSCEKKSYFDFKKDGSLTTINYAIGMGECKPTINAAIYEISADGKELKLSTEDGSITGTLEVKTLTDKVLELVNLSDHVTTFRR